MVQNYLVSLKYYKCWVKSYLLHGNFTFSSIETVCVFTIVYFMSALQHPHEIYPNIKDS